jgi:hypothetical protein
MKSIALALALLLTPALASAKGAQRTARASTSATTERAAKPEKSDDKSDASETTSSSSSSTKTSDGKTLKTKTYTFGAMDVEGKLKTPQLLYFLNRVKLELDMSAPDKRSFMKELARSADDKAL